MAEDETKKVESEDEAKKVESEDETKKVEPIDVHNESPSTESASINDQCKDHKSLQQQIESLQQQVEEISDKYLRATAEIENIKNRNKKSQASLIKYDGQQLAHDVLPILDNLERALQTKVTDDQAISLKQGVELVQQNFIDILTNNGIIEIKAEGKMFDPNIHQAIQSVSAETDDQKDHVTSVLQKGYQLKDRVLRPAMVVVAQ